MNCSMTALEKFRMLIFMPPAPITSRSSQTTPTCLRLMPASSFFSRPERSTSERLNSSSSPALPFSASDGSGPDDAERIFSALLNPRCIDRTDRRDSKRDRLSEFCDRLENRRSRAANSSLPRRTDTWPGPPSSPTKDELLDRFRPDSSPPVPGTPRAPALPSALSLLSVPSLDEWSPDDERTVWLAVLLVSAAPVVVGYGTGVLLLLLFTGGTSVG